MHQLAHRLCGSHLRVDVYARPLHKEMLAFFHRYLTVTRERTTSSAAGASDAEELTSLAGAELLTVDVQGAKVRLLRSALFAMLQSLARGSTSTLGVEADAAEEAEMGNMRDALLKLLLTPAGSLPAVTDAASRPVQLLNEQLRATMLSSTHDSIVKIALASADSSTALSMICTFGLTTFSAQRLLASLDELSPSSIAESLELSKRARMFVTAYRRGGAQGGEKFLATLDASVASAAAAIANIAKEEEEETDKLYLPPPPTIIAEQTAQQLAALQPVMTKVELNKHLKAMVASSSFSLTQDDYRAAAESEAATEVCLEFLESNLKFFLANAGAFNDMIQMVVAASENYPKSKSKLCLLCAKVLKSASVPAVIETQIRKLAATPAAVGTTTVITVPTKKAVDLSAATPDDLLETLVKRKTMSWVEKTRFISRFLMLRPEIVECNGERAEMERQVAKMFSHQSRIGLEPLIAQLTLRCTAETTEKVLRHLLARFSGDTSAISVLSLVHQCCTTMPSLLKELTPAELKIAGAYIVERASAEDADEECLLILGDFVDELVSIVGLPMLRELALQCMQVARSNASPERRRAAAALLELLEKRFPCLAVSERGMQASLKGAQHKLATADRQVALLVTTIFSCADDSDVASAIDALTIVMENQPLILLRQLPVMARLTVRITESTTQQVRETRRYRWVINFVIAATAKLIPHIPLSYTPEVDRVMDSLLELYERHVKGTRDEPELTIRILNLMAEYAKHRMHESRGFLSTLSGQRITGLLEKTNEPFVDLRLLINAEM